LIRPPSLFHTSMEIFGIFITMFGLVFLSSLTPF